MAIVDSNRLMENLFYCHTFSLSFIMNQHRSKSFFVSLLLLPISAVAIALESVPASGKTTTEQPAEIWKPQPREVTPGKNCCDQPVTAPSDAIILFDGKDLSQWESVNGGEAKWPVADGIVTVNKKKGNICTKDSFRNFQLHIEWKIPVEVQNGTHTQHRGNSGIFLQGRYEIQILDSYRHATYIDGQAGSIYKQYPPLVNAMNPPGEWNLYDIIYTAPTFTEDGNFLTYPTVTVLHNGVLIQNHSIINGKTKHGDGPIILQAHRDKTTSEVSFRNIWIREL